MNESDLYKNIIKKYPQYSGVSQAELMPKIYQKYPQYQKSIETSPKASRRDFAMAGAPGYSLMPGAEDVLPAVGQTMGSLIPGFGYPGSVAGATIGRGAQKTIQGIRSGKPSVMPVMDYAPDLAKEAAGTAAIEGVFRVAPRALFPKQFGGKAREAAGKALGQLRDKVGKSAPFLRMSKNDIILRIDDALNSSPFESGPQRQALVKIKNRLSNMKQPLSFDEAVKLEQQMGREAQFASEATQGRFAKGPKAPDANKALKTERSLVSNKVDDMADQAGFPEHKKLSSDYAELAQKYPEKDLQKMYDPMGMLIRGAIGGLAAPFLFNPVAGATVGLPLMWANIPPKVKTAVFRRAIDTPLGKAVGHFLSKGASQVARMANQS